MKKNTDNKNRLRSKIVSFRMSPEEAIQLNRFVQLSGLTKQDYLIRRSLKRDVVVEGNPRVYKALRNQISFVYEELVRLESASNDQSELLELMHYIADILKGLKEEQND